MTLPAATEFTGGSITEAQFKTAMTSLRAYLAALLGTNETDKVAALTALGAILCDSLDKTGAYTVVAADKGKVITCDGTFSLSLTAAATLGDGFAFGVWNTGSGTITIDPSGSELIDGATTKAIAAGKMVVVYCDGTKFAFAGSADGGDAATLDGLDSTAFKKKSGATAGTQYQAVSSGGSVTSETYTKICSARFLVGGTFRVSFKGSINGSGTGYYRIRKNGTDFGTERISPSQTTWTEDLAFAAGDVIQIYAKNNQANESASVSEVAIGCSDIAAFGALHTEVRTVTAFLE